MSKYILSNLLCPHDGTYLRASGPLAPKAYTYCPNCGFQALVDSRVLPLITDDAGNGIDPIATQPELKRPEER